MSGLVKEIPDRCSSLDSMARSSLFPLKIIIPSIGMLSSLSLPVIGYSYLNRTMLSKGTAPDMNKLQLRKEEDIKKFNVDIQIGVVSAY